jgi:hypothetical protein
MSEAHYLKIFELGKQYLCEEVNEDQLNKRLYPVKAKTIDALFKRLLESLKNRRNMKDTIGELEQFKRVLFSFYPQNVVKEYADWQPLFKRIQTECKPKSKMDINRENSYWVIFCKGTLSSARFLSRFSSFDEFNEFVERFYLDDYSRAALPMLIEKEVYGLGFALACDFLKESGYTKYAKPDRHIKEIFSGLGICGDKDNDYKVFQTILRFAKAVNQEPYTVDKLFWLIGSGKLYLNKTKEKGKSDFIKICRNTFQLTT